jgi:hypothetical protein
MVLRQAPARQWRLRKYALSFPFLWLVLVGVVPPSGPNRGGTRSRRYLDERDCDVDVPTRGLGVRARLVGLIDESLRRCGVNVRQADVEAGSERIRVAGLSKIGLRIDRMFLGKSKLSLGGRDGDRADEAGRPPGCEQLLRIGAFAGAAGRRQLDGKTAVIAPGRAVAAAGCTGPARIKNLIDSRHGVGSDAATLMDRVFSEATRCPLRVSGMFSDRTEM